MFTSTIISKPKPRIQLLLTCQILQVQSAPLSSERLADGLALLLKLGEGRALGWVCSSAFFFLLCWEVKVSSRQGGVIMSHQFIVLRFHTGVTHFGVVIIDNPSVPVQYTRIITRGVQCLSIF
jgi:hypothetical protein